jgi:hypothetical protein
VNRTHIIQIALGMLLILSSTSVLAADTAPPQIVHEPCETFQKGVAYEVVARFYDESPIFDPKVVFRRGKGKWQNRRFKRQGGNDNFVALIPARFLKKGSIEYFIEAFDENGNGPARYGSTDAPVLLSGSSEASTCQQVPDSTPVNFYTGEGSKLPDAPKVEHEVAPTPAVEAPAPVSDAQRALTTPVVAEGADGCELADAPFYCSPWFWAATTALVTGGGLATYFLTAGGGDAVETGATINLVITSAPNPTGIN